MLLAYYQPQLDIKNLDVNLHGYFESQSVDYSMAGTDGDHVDPPHITQEPIWQTDAKSIASDWKQVAFLEMTDVVKNANFEEANG